jgi:regulator of replication initiation timing
MAENYNQELQQENIQTETPKVEENIQTETPKVEETVQSKTVIPSVNGDDPPYKKLWKGLVDEGLYSGSFEDFQKKYSTSQEIEKLHKGLVEEDLYSKGVDDFYIQYFPELKKKDIQSPGQNLQNGGQAGTSPTQSQSQLPSKSEEPKVEIGVPIAIDENEPTDEVSLALNVKKHKGNVLKSMGQERMFDVYYNKQKQSLYEQKLRESGIDEKAQEQILTELKGIPDEIYEREFIIESGEKVKPYNKPYLGRLRKENYPYYINRVNGIKNDYNLEKEGDKKASNKLANAWNETGMSQLDNFNSTEPEAIVNNLNTLNNYTTQATNIITNASSKKATGFKTTDESLNNLKESAGVYIESNVTPDTAKDYLSNKIDINDLKLKYNQQDLSSIISGQPVPKQDLDEYTLSSIKSKLDPNSVVDQMVFNVYSQKVALEDAFQSGTSIEDAAMSYRKSLDPEFSGQIDALEGNVNRSTRGQTVDAFISDPAVLEYAKKKPELYAKILEAKMKFNKDFPEYAKSKLLQKIGSVYQKEYANAFVNNPTTDKLDIIVDKLLKEGQITEEDVNTYKTEIAPKQKWFWKTVRGLTAPVGGTEWFKEDIVPVADFTSGLTSGIYGTLHNAAGTIEQGMKFIPGIPGAIASQVFSDKAVIDRALAESTTAQVDPIGWGGTMYQVGEVTGFAATLAMMGIPAGAMGLGAEATHMLTTALAFYGENKKEALLKIPGNTFADEVERQMLTGSHTAIDLYLTKFLDINKISKGALSLLKKDVSNVIGKLRTGEITQAKVGEEVWNKVKDFGVRYGQNSLKNATIMNSFTAAHDALNKLFNAGGKELPEIAEEYINNFIPTLKSTVLLNLFASVKPGERITVGKTLFDMAKNPEYYREMINKKYGDNPKLQAEKEDLLNNLDEVTAINKNYSDPIFKDLTEAQRQKILLLRMQANIYAEKATSTQDPTASKSFLDKSNELSKQIETITKGKDKATEHEIKVPSTTSQTENEKVATEEAPEIKLGESVDDVKVYFNNFEKTIKDSEEILKQNPDDADANNAISEARIKLDALKKDPVKYFEDEKARVLEDLNKSLESGTPKEDLAIDEVTAKYDNLIKQAKAYGEKNAAGISGVVGEGQTSQQVQSVEGGGTEATSTGGVLQTSGAEGEGKGVEQKVGEVTAEVPKQKEIEQLRADEQAELDTKIPNAEQYKVDGKVDRSKLTNEEDIKVFDEVYNKYDKLITPLLKEGVGEAKAEVPQQKLEEGTTIELPAQVKGGVPRQMIYKDGVWQQQVGGQTTKVGENVQKQAQAQFESSQPATPEYTRNVSVLITPATIRSFNDLTARMKKLSLAYDDLVKSMDKNPSEKKLKQIKALELQILEQAKKEIAESVAKVNGVEVKFGSDNMGSWQGKAEPSINMTLRVSANVDTKAISDIINDFGERYSQDAIILELNSEYHNDILTGKKNVKLSDFEGNFMYYPKFIYNFKSKLSAKQRAALSNALKKEGIEEYTLGDDKLEISVIKYLSESEQNLTNQEQFKLKQDDYKQKGESAAKAISNSLGNDRISTFNINHKKSKYISGKESGTDKQQRKYDRSDLFEDITEGLRKTQESAKELAQLRNKQIELQKQGKKLSPEESSRLEELMNSVVPIIEETLEGKEKKFQEAKNEVESIAEKVMKSISGFVSKFPAKRPSRGAIKVARWYSAFTEKLGDAARVNLIVSDNVSADKAFNIIKKEHGNVSDAELRNVNEATDLGYPKRLIEIRTSNGTIAEIQVMTPKGYLAKDGVKEFPKEKQDIAKKELQEVRDRLKWNIPDGLGHYLYEINRDLNISESLRNKAKELSIKYYDAFLNTNSKLSQKEFTKEISDFKKQIDAADKSSWDKGNSGKSPETLNEYLETQKSELEVPEQSALEKAKEERKAAKEKLNNIRRRLNIIPDPKEEAKALFDYHKALVAEAKEYIKAGIKTVEEWAKEINENVNIALKSAWDEATGKTSPTEKAEDLKYTIKDLPKIETEETKMANAVNDAFIEGKFGTDVLDNIIAKLQDTDVAKIYSTVKEKIKSGIITAKEVRDKIITTKEGSEADQAVLMYDLAELKGKEAGLMNEMINESNPDKQAEIAKKIMDVQNEMQDNALANRYLGRTASSIFRLRQLWVNRGMDLATMEKQYMSSKGLKSLTPEQSKEIKEAYTQIAETKAKLEKTKGEVDALIQENERIKLENEKLKELKDQSVAKEKEDRNKKASEKLSASAERVKKIKDNLRGLRGNMSSGVDPKIAIEIGKLAAEKFYQGAVKLDVLVKDILDDVKDIFPNWTENDVRSHLFPDLKDANKYFTEQKDYTSSKKELKDKIDEYKALQSEYAKSLFEWQKERRTDLMDKRPWSEKLADKIYQWQRFAVLSYPTTFVKLAAVVGHNLLLKPFKFGYQKVIANIAKTISSDFAGKMGVYGDPSLKAMAKYYSEFIRNFSISNLKEQFSGIDTREILYGDKFMYDEWSAGKGLLEMPGRSHGYIKSFVKNPEFQFAHEMLVGQSMTKMAEIGKQMEKEENDAKNILKDERLLARAIDDLPSELYDKISELTGKNNSVGMAGAYSRMGDNISKQIEDIIINEKTKKIKAEYDKYDVTNEEVLMRINKLSLEHGKDAILMGDNKAVDKFRELTKGSSAASTFLKTEAPIVKIPMNFINRALLTKYGLMQAITGKSFGAESTQHPSVAKLIFKGTEGLTEAQGQALSKAIMYGSMGATMFALGYFNKDKVKLNEDGSIELNGMHISKNLVHVPEFESFFSGAETAHKFKDEKSKFNWIESFLLSDMEILKKNPFLNMLEYGLVGNLINALTDKRMKDESKIKLLEDATNNKVINMAVPGFSKQLAQWMDTEEGGKINPMGTPIKRKPQGDWGERFVQSLEMAIPGLRQLVPTGEGKKIFDEKQIADSGILKRYQKLGVDFKGIPAADKLGTDEPLTPEQYDKFVEAYQKEIKIELLALADKEFQQTVQVESDGEMESVPVEGTEGSNIGMLSKKFSEAELEKEKKNKDYKKESALQNKVDEIMSSAKNKVLIRLKYKKPTKSWTEY